MSIDPSTGILLACLSAFAYAGVSGLVPVLNVEIYLLTATAILDREYLLPVLLTATLGQMSAKSLLYLAGRGAINLPLPRVQNAMVAVESWGGSHQRRGGLFILLTSASGVPPFYAVSLASGMARFHFPTFLVCGSAGRFLRFAAVVLATDAVKTLLL